MYGGIGLGTLPSTYESLALLFVARMASTGEFISVYQRILAVPPLFFNHAHRFALGRATRKRLKHENPCYYGSKIIHGVVLHAFTLNVAD
jgi:hypothetical protein